MTFKIDLHVHSAASGDNNSDAEEAVVRAIEIGLDGIAFTEHYTYEASSQADRLSEKYGDRIMIFRGVEFSAAEGHCLIFGVNIDGLFEKYVSVSEILRYVNEQGGVIIPSHPYRGANSMGDIVKNLHGICAVEGYNGCNMHSLNQKAIAAAHAMNIPFTGGSDAHAPSEVGSCYTEFADEVTYDTFIMELKQGNYTGIDRRKISRMWL